MGIRFLLYMIAVCINLIIIEKWDSFTFALKCFLVVGQILVCFVWTCVDFPEVFLGILVSQRKLFAPLPYMFGSRHIGLPDGQECTWIQIFLSPGTRGFGL